jgi:hypothetical protein
MAVKPIAFTDVGRYINRCDYDLLGFLYNWNRQFGSALTLIIIMIDDDNDIQIYRRRKI